MVQYITKNMSGNIFNGDFKFRNICVALTAIFGGSTQKCYIFFVINLKYMYYL